MIFDLFLEIFFRFGLLCVVVTGHVNFLIRAVLDLLDEFRNARVACLLIFGQQHFDDLLFEHVAVVRSVAVIVPPVFRAIPPPAALAVAFALTRVGCFVAATATCFASPIVLNTAHITVPVREFGISHNRQHQISSSSAHWADSVYTAQLSHSSGQETRRRCTQARHARVATLSCTLHVH